jgi:NAD(P)-dependent dehydrogenase (short-subunit alcohol dehydrogenase family)
MTDEQDEQDRWAERIATAAGSRLEGRVALVTGAGQTPAGPIGVGAATAIVLAASGASVVVLDLSPEAGERTVTRIEKEGGRATFVQANVSSRDDCGRAAEHAVDAYGRLDALVNSAATNPHGPVLQATEDDYLRAYRVNTIGSLFMVQTCAPHLFARGGSIVNVGSTASVRPVGASGYAESKAALEALTRELAVSLGRQKVRANCIHPGNLHAPMTAGQSEEVRQRLARQNPIGRLGTGWDVALAALFFCSEESEWITGTTLCIDGGATLMTSASFEHLTEL